jgi:hypothetical protein
MANVEYRVNVYRDETYDEVVARVRYNQDLDYWDGHNYTNGGTGLHLGITKLKSGEYVLIHGTQWQGGTDRGVIVSADAALQAILKSGNAQLLDTKKFKGLKELAIEKGILGDCEETDEEER